MKNFIKILFSVSFLLCVYTVHAQVNTFKAYKETNGIITKNSNGLYVWGSWAPSQTTITLDLDKQTITTSDASNKETAKFEIFEKPQQWTMKKDYKFVKYECMNSLTLQKYYVMLSRYDSGALKITIMSPNDATRYFVRLDNGNEQENLTYDDEE